MPPSVPSEAKAGEEARIDRAEAQASAAKVGGLIDACADRPAAERRRRGDRVRAVLHHQRPSCRLPPSGHAHERAASMRSEDLSREELGCSAAGSLLGAPLSIKEREWDLLRASGGAVDLSELRNPHGRARDGEGGRRPRERRRARSERPRPGQSRRARTRSRGRTVPFIEAAVARRRDASRAFRRRSSRTSPGTGSPSTSHTARSGSSRLQPRPDGELAHARAAGGADDRDLQVGSSQPHAATRRRASSSSRRASRRERAATRPTSAERSPGRRASS